MVSKGGIVRDQPGPRPPDFPGLDADNMAVRLGGNGARFEIKDTGPQSPYDFTNGDALSLEAWLRVDEIRPGQPAYVIGKGRTHSPKFSRDNQNWSMRVIGGQGGLAKLGFLFTSVSGSGQKHWHRWTSVAAFKISTGWHHVALAYEFGKPGTMRGWIDGIPTEGTWDVDGTTVDPPVVDDDDVWIGSALNGSAGNSFQGMLDMVAIHRVLLTDAEMASRFQRKDGPQIVQPAKPEMPVLGEIPRGKVVFQLGEGLSDFKSWSHQDEVPPVAEDWTGDAFLLPRIPKRYDSWGIRSAWKPPVLLRIAADVDLPAGEQRFLLRARALSRLWVDGKLVVETKPADAMSPNGHDLVTPLAEPPHPGLRVKDYKHQEVFGTLDLPDKGCPSRVVLEVVVGGKNQRTETGEVCVAIESATGDSYSVLRPSGIPHLPLTDAEVEPMLVRMETEMAAFDDNNRRTAAASRKKFWENRHALAKEWVASNPPPKPPKTGHPIDAFLDSKIESALAANATASTPKAREFHGEILPLLREKCFRCHGEKTKGGLKLDSREAALKGGDSEIPSIVPGNPDASELLVRLKTKDEDLAMPPSGDGLDDAQVTKLARWIKDGAQWPATPVDPAKVARTPLTSDEAFLRRIYLDILGVPPSAEEARAFPLDKTPGKRAKLVDHLLADPRAADHQMSQWLDLLAENPTLINASLNSTGPFRWFLYDAFRDRKPMDRIVTELLMMRGDAAYGGSAGFAQAAENDAPFAAKGHIVASAFLGIELQCARCHDSPYHSTTQKDLYSLAAMLSRKTLTVPKTSQVPAGFFEKKGRESLIHVTLKPDEPVAPEWPFPEATGVSDGEGIDRLVEDPKDLRERFTALVTAPDNLRFSRVLANRIWKRLMGAGLVEPAQDWEGRDASHPALLEWLAAELVSNGYDTDHLVRLIVTSRAYQLEPSAEDLAALAPGQRFFNAPGRRRLTAEQVLDSLHASTGKTIDSEELTFVYDGRHPLGRRQTLGIPRRGWMFASLNNERDRPSLALPHAQASVDVMEAFGWNGSRQMPVFARETEPNVLQPGILANGTLMQVLSRASWRSELADLAVEAKSPSALLDTLYLRFLSRLPRWEERDAFLPEIAKGFEGRLVPESRQTVPVLPPPLPLATWLNHVSPEANTIQLEVEKRVQQGPPPDPRLEDGWREVYEDIVWTLANIREFAWIP
jgi:cytochrome c553